MPSAAENTTPEKPVDTTRAKREEKLDSVLVASGVAGVVKWYNVKNRYGFITRDDNGEDIFVHVTSISKKNPKHLQRSVGEGEKVQFSVFQSDKGSEAREVTGPDGGPVKGSKYAAVRGSYNPGYSRGNYQGGYRQGPPQDFSEDVPPERFGGSPQDDREDGGAYPRRPRFNRRRQYSGNNGGPVDTNRPPPQQRQENRSPPTGGGESRPRNPEGGRGRRPPGQFRRGPPPNSDQLNQQQSPPPPGGRYPRVYRRTYKPVGGRRPADQAEQTVDEKPNYNEEHVVQRSVEDGRGGGEPNASQPNGSARGRPRNRGRFRQRGPQTEGKPAVEKPVTAELSAAGP